jgi:hypothetical protein
MAAIAVPWTPPAAMPGFEVETQVFSPSVSYSERTRAAVRGEAGTTYSVVVTCGAEGNPTVTLPMLDIVMQATVALARDRLEIGYGVPNAYRVEPDASVTLALAEPDPAAPPRVRRFGATYAFDGHTATVDARLLDATSADAAMRLVGAKPAGGLRVLGQIAASGRYLVADVPSPLDLTRLLRAARPADAAFGRAFAPLFRLLIDAAAAAPYAFA